MTNETCVVPFLRDKQLQHLNQIAERPKLDIEFKNLSYSVRNSRVEGGWSQILNAISGKFRCGELSAILGPSGAGKTTLLNILAGYIKWGVQGTVKVNNHVSDLKTFKKLSAYIMQEDIVQPRLTVKEAMNYAANLKLGSHITHQDKAAVVEEVLTFLGLENCMDTYSEYLSGGERKRLTIALELVNNPPVIFLDEPTTGLDNVAIRQCIDLLKKITNLNRTVIFTIHQPPSSLFQIFDKVYIIANGFCVYNGSPSQLVSFFTLAGHSCPSNNTPADYMIELVQSDPAIIHDFKTKIQNGEIESRNAVAKEPNIAIGNNEEVYLEFIHTIEKSHTDFATSYQTQLLFLLSRMLLQTSRVKIGLFIQIFHHILSGLFIGLIFLKIGDDATQFFTIIKCCFGCTMYIIFTYTMTTVLLFPFEVQLLKREYFNRWYSLKAFYTAWTLVNAPPVIILCSIFTTLVYFITNQPPEISRFIGFYLIVLFVALTSQSLGFVLAAILDVKNGAIVASAVLTVLGSLGIYGMGYESRATIGAFFNVLISLSFLRHGLLGLCSVLFYQRDRLTCGKDSLDCPFTEGDRVLSRMSVDVTDYRYSLAYLCIFILMFRFIGYFLLKSTLNTESTSKMLYYFQTLFSLQLQPKICFRKNKTDIPSIIT